MTEWLWIVPIAAAIFILLISAWMGHGLFDENGDPKPLNFNCDGWE